MMSFLFLTLLVIFHVECKNQSSSALVYNIAIPSSGYNGYNVAIPSGGYNGYNGLLNIGRYNTGYFPQNRLNNNLIQQA